MGTFLTIKSSEEISNLFSTGSRFSNKYVTFIVKPITNSSNTTVSKNNQSPKIKNSSNSEARVAFIAGKKHGNAVWRNSAKRRLREIYFVLNNSSNNYTKKFKILLIAKPSLLNASYSEVLEKCIYTMKEINSCN